MGCSSSKDGFDPNSIPPGWEQSTNNMVMTATATPAQNNLQALPKAPLSPTTTTTTAKTTGHAVSRSRRILVSLISQIADKYILLSHQAEILLVRHNSGRTRVTGQSLLCRHRREFLATNSPKVPFMIIIKRESR